MQVSDGFGHCSCPSGFQNLLSILTFQTPVVKSCGIFGGVLN